MALTVSPPASFSEFGWIFNNNHLDSSIYQDDDDIMEFSDSSGGGEFQPQNPQQTHQVRKQNKIAKSFKSYLHFVYYDSDKIMYLSNCCTSLKFLTWN